MNKTILLLACWFSAVCSLAQESNIPVISVGDFDGTVQIGEPAITWIKTNHAWFPDWKEMPNLTGQKEAGQPRIYLEGPPFALWNDSTYHALSKINLPELDVSKAVFVSRFILDNSTNQERTILTKLPMGWQANLYYYPIGDTLFNNEVSSDLQYSFNGKWVPVSERPIPHYQAIHKLVLGPHQSFEVMAEIRPFYSLYKSALPVVNIYTEETFLQENKQRHLWQGIFFGVILVMALYNLFLFFAVKDNSYLHYVLSIIGVGLYFAFYYGFGIEYLWPNQPRWDTWCYTLIVPFTSLARLWFTRTYLHTPTTLPALNRFMNVLNLLMSATLIIGLITFLTNTDWLAPLVTTIGILNTFILMIMLVAGIMAYRQKYAPARYFIYANAPLVVGAIAFILRELGYLPDGWFTRYSVQVGVVIQVVLFALGLASRLNQTRSELAAQRIEKERLALEAEKERKGLIEQQKTQLEDTVRLQTQSLREQNEKLTQLNAVKDKLFSVLTHDLRNPLATMQSFLKLLTEQYEKLNEEEKEKLFKEAQESLDHLNRLLFHLLQWSKSQMNLLAFAPERLGIRDSVEKNRRVLHLQARMKNIEIINQVPAEIEVLADANMVDFILRNLISNAIKFSPKGKVVTITGEVADKVTLKITDEGVGISPEMVQQIMQATVTATKRGTDKERGTGLGLLISKEFIEKNSGNFTVNSTLGKGTTVAFTLPMFAPNHDS